MASNQGRTQIPVYDIQVESENAIAAPSYRIRPGEKLKDIAEEMQFSAQANGMNVKITEEDIKRWNPGVTDDNLHTDSKYKTLKFKPEDPELEKSDN